MHKAYPSDTITPPPNPATQVATSDTTYQSVIEACQYLGLFTKIADAAGKHLSVASFTKAGYGLKNATIPGMGGPISFAPGQPYAIGPVTIVHYNPKTETLVPTGSTQWRARAGEQSSEAAPPRGGLPWSPERGRGVRSGPSATT